MPNERVTTQLNVRHDPKGSSAVVGALRPGEAAKLEGSVPFWYEVTLSDGTRGYVSKAWSKIIPEATGASGFIRLGEWNLKKLGHGTSKDFAAVAKVINDNFDILAVVEVMQKGGAHPGYDALLSRLGSDWAGVISAIPRPNTSSGNSEFYAILYRPNLVKTCDGWTELRYLTDNDGGPSGTGPDIFSREPAFGCFAVKLANGATGFDFTLAAYHARWADGDAAEIQDEVRHVTEVFTAMGRARPGENDRILVGDFNLTTPDLEATLGPQVETLGSGSTLNTLGERTANLYDHLLLFDRAATQEMVGSPEITDVREVAASPKVFYTTVSDHLPLRAQFRSGPDDD